MPTVDADHHEIELRILVMGGASVAFLEALPLQAGALPLGELQGWRPILQFRAFGVDPWAAEADAGREFEAFLPYADALVLTDGLGGGEHYSSAAIERLRRTLGPTRVGMPTAIFGFEALAEEWRSLSGVEPVSMHGPKPEHAMATVKAVAGALLRSRLRSIPPPPPPA